MGNRVVFKNGDVVNGVTYMVEVNPITSGNQKKRMAEFMCYCGKRFISALFDVKSGKISSCGCLKRDMLRKKRVHYTEGSRINGILFVRNIEDKSYGGVNIRMGLFLCECGVEFEAAIRNIVSGTTKSCGCYARMAASIANRKHGYCGTKVYSIWKSMKDRCLNKNNSAYENYGGRGISVSEEFLTDPKCFIDYVSTLPCFGNKGYSIDRINNDGNYERGNIRWATRSTQTVNKRKHSNNTVGYTGVYERKPNYYAVIRFNNKTKWISGFKTPEQAAIARDLYIIDNNMPHKLSGLPLTLNP